MPQWLCHQLEKSFRKKDIRQIRLLNDCWFFYRTKIIDAKQAFHISRP